MTDIVCHGALQDLSTHHLAHSQVLPDSPAHVATSCKGICVRCSSACEGRVWSTHRDLWLASCLCLHSQDGTVVKLPSVRKTSAHADYLSQVSTLVIDLLACSEGSPVLPERPRRCPCPSLHLTAITSYHARYSTAHKRRRISGGGQTEEPPMDLQFHRRSCGGEFPSPTRAPSAFSSKGSALRVRSRSAASSGLSTASPSSQVCWCPARTPVPCRSCLRLDQLIHSLSVHHHGGSRAVQYIATVLFHVDDPSQVLTYRWGLFS